LNIKNQSENFGFLFLCAFVAEWQTRRFVMMMPR
jgi:hypothetical protein